MVYYIYDNFLSLKGIERLQFEYWMWNLGMQPHWEITIGILDV